MAKKGGIANIAVSSEPMVPKPANTGIEARPQTSGGDDMSTTQRLFGDLVQDDLTQPVPAAEPLPQEPPPEPAAPPAPAPGEPAAPAAPAAPSPAVPAPAQPAPAPAQPTDELNIDQFGTHKVKTKVDGVEGSVSLKDLRDQYQIRQHLNLQADKIGEERRRLAEERRQFQELRAAQPRFPIPADAPAPIPGQPAGANRNVPPGTPEAFNVVMPLLSRIQSLENTVRNMAQSTEPLIMQQNRNAVDQELRSLGFTDFNDYWPKIQATIPIDLVQSVGGNEMAASKLWYFQLKSQEQPSPRQAAPLPAAPQPAPAAPAPARPPIMKVDGGSQPAGGMNDDAQANYRKLFRQFQQNPEDRELGNRLLQAKGILPD